MEHYTNGFAPETAVTAIIRLIMIGLMLAGGIYVIRNGFNAKEND